MERKPDPQQVEVITVQPEALQSRNKVLRAALLVFLMLWPWLVVSYGLFKLKDYRVTIALYELLCCVLPVMLFRMERLPVWPLKCSFRQIVLLCVIANIVLLSLFKLSHGFAMDWPLFSARSQGIAMHADVVFWGYGIYLVFFNPLFEEGFWRGVIYQEWRTLLGPWPANIISSIFFGGWHWVILQHFCPPLWATLLTLVVMVGGVLFAYTYEKTGTLGAPILLHGWGADFPLVFVVYTALTQSAG